MKNENIWNITAIIFLRLSTFFTYLRIKGKKDGKVTFVLKRKPYG